MANIPTFYSDANPSTRPGIAPSIGAERSQVQNIPDASVRKWGPQGAGAIANVSKDWGAKILQARDVHEMNKAKIFAQEEYSKLLVDMSSPEFKSKNGWGEYGGHYSRKSADIQAAISEQFGGSALAKNRSLNLMLRQMHGTNETKVSGMARVGEVEEMQRAIPESLEYYSRDAADAARGEPGDPKAIINAMSNARSYLDSMQKAGVITGAQHNAYLDNFQDYTNNVVHKERIFDAAANANKKQSVAKLSQLVKDYSEPREDLDEDQRVTYKHMAQQALSTKLREESQTDQFAKYQLEEARKNSLAIAKERGEGGLISAGRFGAVYGNKGNKAAAEYQSYLDDYKYSLRHNGVMSNVDAMPPIFYQGALDDYKTKMTTHDEASILNDAEQRANQNVQMLLDDPAKFVQERAKVPQDLEGTALYEAQVLEQVKRGVGEKEVALLTNDQAKRSVGILTGASADEAITGIIGMKKQYGKHFSTVMRDMQQQKLPVAYELVARMNPEPTGDRKLMEDILKANSLNDQEWGKTMGIDAQLMRQQVNDQINTQFKPHEDAMMNSAVTPDDIKKVGDLKTLMGNLALYRMEAGSLALSDISTATSTAVRDVMEQYDVIPNQKSRFNIGSFGFGGQDPINERFVIPKNWAEKIGKDKTVYNVLQDSRDKLIDTELNSTINAMVQKNAARGFEPFSAEDVAAAREAFVREAYWATDNEKDGLILMSDNGLRLRVTYDKILEWSKEVPK